MPKYNLDDDYENELDEELAEEFGEDISNIVSQRIKTPKKNNHKDLKFKKDGYYDRNRK